MASAPLTHIVDCLVVDKCGYVTEILAVKDVAYYTPSSLFTIQYWIIDYINP